MCQWKKLKIGQYLAKIWTKVWGLLFGATLYTCTSAALSWCSYSLAVSCAELGAQTDRQTNSVIVNNAPSLPWTAAYSETLETGGLRWTLLAIQRTLNCRYRMWLAVNVWCRGHCRRGRKKKSSKWPVTRSTCVRSAGIKASCVVATERRLKPSCHSWVKIGRGLVFFVFCRMNDCCWYMLSPVDCSREYVVSAC